MHEKSYLNLNFWRINHMMFASKQIPIVCHFAIYIISTFAMPTLTHTRIRTGNERTEKMRLGYF